MVAILPISPGEFKRDPALLMTGSVIRIDAAF
jgi:hypothetical protein